MADGVVAGMLLATIVSLVSPSVVWSSHGGQMQEQSEPPDDLSYIYVFTFAKQSY